MPTNRKRRERLTGSDRITLVLEAARLFHEERLQKQEIAKKLGTSNVQVSRLLQEAWDREFVRVTLHPPELSELGSDLVKRYGVLEEAMVVSASSDHSFERRLCAEAAAKYFEKIVKDRMSIAVGGGSTLRDLVTALQPRERDIDIYSTALVGGGPTLGVADRLSLVSLLWVKSGSKPGRAHYSTVLPFQGRPSDVDPESFLLALRKESHEFRQRDRIRKVFEGMLSVDVAIVSLGPVANDPEYGQRFAPGTSLVEIMNGLGIEEDYFSKQGAIGEVGYAFFDKQGDTREEWECFISLGVTHYKKMVHERRPVLMIANSGYKVDALRAALRGKLFNRLVTDEQTARALLEPEESPQTNSISAQI